MKTIQYIHGKGGSYRESEQYKKNCEGFDIIGVDYNDFSPWVVKDQIKKEFDRLAEKGDEIYLLANSIGTYYAMLALQDRYVEKALFISPILDMEELILDMLSWANSSEDELKQRKEITTEFNETLSWNYLKYVREHPIKWKISTEILYAENDNLTAYETVKCFVASHNAKLTIMDGGEHWFHTDEQINFLNTWMRKVTHQS